MPKEFRNQPISGPTPFTYPKMDEDDVFTFAISPTEAGTITGIHLNNPDPIIISGDTSAEDVPGVVNVYGFGWTLFTVANVNGNVTMKSGKSK